MRKTIRTSSISALALAASLAFITAAYAHGDEKHGKDGDVTLMGEVLDLHCYMLHPETGHGADHAKCANSCIDRGLPAGFLADGEVYILLGPGHDAPTELIAGKAGRPVTLTGKLVDHHGMRAIQIESIDSGGAATKPTGHEGHDH